MADSYPHVKVTLPASWEEALETILADLPTQGWQSSGTDAPAVLTGAATQERHSDGKNTLAVTAYFERMPDASAACRTIGERLTLAGLGRDEFSCEAGLTEAQDWETEWRKHLHPLRVGRKWLVRTSWHQSESFDRHTIVVDPKMAFGTGTHPTTQLCLIELEELAHEGVSVLDVGAGTAILSIAAHRLGARPVVGVEIDADSVRCAEENLELNGVSGEIRLYTGSLDVLPPMKPSLIVANIQFTPLLALAPALLEMLAPGGSALFSGILQTEADEFIRRLGEVGWNVVRRRRQFDTMTGEGWTCMVATGR